jgi:hypothetical protein
MTVALSIETFQLLLQLYDHRAICLVATSMPFPNYLVNFREEFYLLFKELYTFVHSIVSNLVEHF